MNNLFIKGTSKTPEIDFAPGIIQISGRSIHEDAPAFYLPVIKWLENYLAKPEKFTKVALSIEYINSSSNRFLFNILKMFEDSHLKGTSISIAWLYDEDDDTIMNLGLDFKAIFTVPFNMTIIT